MPSSFKLWGIEMILSTCSTKKGSLAYCKPSLAIFSHHSPPLDDDHPPFTLPIKFPFYQHSCSAFHSPSTNNMTSILLRRDHLLRMSDARRDDAGVSVQIGAVCGSLVSPLSHFSLAGALRLSACLPYQPIMQLKQGQIQQDRLARVEAKHNNLERQSAYR